MKATRIPGTGSYNITLTIDEMEDLLDQTKPIQKGDETGYGFRSLLHRTINERKELDKQLVDELDAQSAIMTEEKANIDDIIERAVVMSFMDALLFVAKELKVPVFIDTEDEDFKWAKDMWNSSTTWYEDQAKIIKDTFHIYADF